MSTTYETYEAKFWRWFENGEPEEFLLFIQDFKNNLKATGVMSASRRVQYLHTLLHGEDMICFDFAWKFNKDKHRHSLKGKSLRD